MWEYFSYYGMRSLLVLYLTQSLFFTDQHAYAIYGAYTSLVYATPIVGGLLADKILGYRWAVIIGALLMIAGHIVLGTTASDLALFVALAFIVCGYGLFKSNIACLLGQLYKETNKRRESAFAIMYVGGNIGAFIAPIACAFVAVKWGWHYGFALAGLGMAIGLVIFMFGRQHFVGVGDPMAQLFTKRGVMKVSNIIIMLVCAAIAVTVITLILKNLWAGWVLLATAAVTLVLFFKLFVRCQGAQRQGLALILIIMVFGLIFWAFDQQGGSSISLFISRNLDRHLLSFVLPAASFQSVNAAGVLIGGVFVAWLWKKLNEKGVKLGVLIKISMGMVVLSLGFAALTLSAHMAMATGHTSMWLTVLAMLLIGMAELFIDPVALAEITRLNPAGSVGFLAGTYMLVSGSFANYIAAKIAALSSVETTAQHAVNFMNAASKYFITFKFILIISIIATIALFITAYLVKMMLRKTQGAL